jgi:tetratricopeptide (TPR) repeat protein
MADVKVKIFFSYSHEDETLRDELAKYLKPLERQGKIEPWHDRKIEPGKNWRQELDFHLNSADIVLLLVSTDFVNSDFCYCTELERARERHDAGETRIIPIFLRLIDLNALKGTPLETIQGVPEPSQPITSAKWETRDEAFVHVAERIRAVVEQIQQEKEVKQASQVQESRLSPMRTRVLDEHYVERDTAKKLLDRFAAALQQPLGQPLLFNIYGIGGVGKTTLLKRLQEAQADKVDCLEVCFAKTPGIETPLKLMRKLHQQAREFFGVDTSADAFAQKEQLFEHTLFELSKCSVDGEATSSEEQKKITSWFERFIWLGPTNFTSISRKQKSSETLGSGFSALTMIGDDTEDLNEWIQQWVRNHPATKDKPGLQALMLEPVSKLTQAFAESLMQIAQNRERSIVLVLDTYEKAQPYLNQWLWQYLVEDTSLSSVPVRLVVVGRKSLQADEGWRKLNQDRKLLYEVPLQKFTKSDTDEYLKKIGIENAGTRTRIYKLTQGLPFYLDWVRRQREEGKEPDFSEGNQTISKLLFQGIDFQQQQILKVVACCRWFDLAMIRYLLGSDGFDIQQNSNYAERIFEWLKCSDFVESSKQHYRLDDVARDVFRQTYAKDDQNQFRKTNALLADYFKQQADAIFDSQSLLPDPYEDEEWRGMIAEFLYYGLFGKGKEGLQQYIEYFFTAVYLKEPDVFMTPFSFISAEMNEENQKLLPSATDKFFKNSAIVIGFGWILLGIPPQKYKIKIQEKSNLLGKEVESYLKDIEVSLKYLLDRVGDLQAGFGQSIGLVYKSLRCQSYKAKIDSLLLAKRQFENLSKQCHSKLLHSLFGNLGNLLGNCNCFEDSIDCCEKALALELGEDDALIFLRQSISLCGINRSEEALQSYKKAIELDPENSDTWMSQGGASNNLGRYDEALQSYKKAIELDPKKPDIWMSQGDTLYNLRRYDEALQSYKKTIELDPGNPGAWMSQGDTLNSLECYDEALKSYKKTIELDPKNSHTWMSQGMVFKNLGRYNEALRSCKKAIELDPGNSNTWMHQGIVFNESGRYNEALQSHKKAIELDPGNSNTWMHQGGVFNNLRQYDEALESCKKAIELDPKDFNAYSLMALALSLMNDFDNSVQAIDKAINLRHEEVIFRANRSIILARAGRFAEALSDCKLAIKQDSSDECGHYALACCATHQNNIEQAISSLQKAIDIAPHRCRREAKHNPDFDSMRWPPKTGQGHKL